MFGKKTLIAAACSLLSLGALHLRADDTSARAQLIGAWQPKDSAVKDAGIWTFERKGGDVIHITYAVADQKVVELECQTTGMDCKVNDTGKSAKVSMWFSGRNLVSLETRGTEIVKRRFGIEDGDSLEVEIIPIQPDGKTEKVEFRRIKQ
jgi:hypothetical protein